MANTIVSQLTQSTTPAAHLVRDVSTLLSKYEPDLYPLDTLLRQTSVRQKAEQTKIEWESYTTFDRKATTSGASTAAADATTAATLTLSTALTSTPSAAFAPDDILICVKTVNSGKVPDTTLPQLIVVTVPTATTITVKAFDPSTSIEAYILTPIIPSGTILTWIGNAKVEGFSKGVPKMIVPTVEYNYCQIFEALVKISRTRKATKNFTNQHDWDTARKEQLGEFRRSLEYTEWFGKRAETNQAVNDGGAKRWKMGGVTSFIPTTIDYTPSTLAESNLMDWMKQVFMGNNGSPSRMFFVDSELSTAIQKTQISKGRSLETAKVAGLTCQKIVFNEGTLFIKHTRAFNEAGLAHYGVILDLKQLSKRELRPMERLKLDLYLQGTEDAQAEQYIEQSAIQLLNPNTHAIVRGVL